MTARVNLLPQQVRAEGRQSSQRLVALLLVVAVVVGLGVATWLQGQVLGDAEDELQLAQNELAEARAAVAALAMPADLERRQVANRELVTTALGNQVSVAGILQDVAMVMPADSDVSTLSLALPPVEPAEDGSVPIMGSAGTLMASGESLEDIAPGIERLMLQFQRPAGFRDVYVTSATTDEEDVTSYSLELELGPEHRTGRYVTGVPEVLR